jgi:hypothetical protein
VDFFMNRSLLTVDISEFLLLINMKGTLLRI